MRLDECYHLAAQSYVSYAFDDEFYTLNTNISGTQFMLSAVKNSVPACGLCFAGSSEMFGEPEQITQTEGTRFHPRSPYWIGNVAGVELTRRWGSSKEFQDQVREIVGAGPISGRRPHAHLV